MPRIKQNDKRDRLVEAADQLIYEKTFHTTTLADIAKLADVPLGNVYYYFKTKEAIMEAVLSKRAHEWQSLFESWEELEVRERLSAFINHTVEKSEQLARFGCTMGSLCQELSKQGGAVAQGATKLMSDVLAWTENQFNQMGKSEESKKLAEHFLAGIQGMSLLTLTFKDPSYIERQSKTLNHWLSSL